MIIVCDSCSTKFRLDPERLKGGSGKVRCTRCGNVFKVEVPGEEETFRVELSDEPFQDEEEFDAPPQMPHPAAPPMARPGRRARKWPSFVVVGLLVLGVLGFWLTQKGIVVPPSTPQGKGPPAEEPQQPTVTIMDSTQAYFLQNPQAGQIFLVEGEVVNESARPVSFVLLEGRLYSKGNQVAQSQRCYAGNFMTREELVKLSMNDIQNRMMNREGKELSNVHIPAGKRIPFLLVFHNLPELDSLSDYSVEVISAKFE